MFKSDYSDLLNLPGYVEVKEMLETWEIVANNIKDHLEDGKVIIPNYLFVVTPGSGTSHLIEVLADKLFELGLMPFSNQRKAIEFLLEYQEDKDSFDAFERLFNLLEHGLSQFGEPFAGVLAIDITDWVEKLACDDKRFIRFLHYLIKRDDIQMIIFITNCQKPNHVKDCEAVISSIIRIEKIQVKQNTSESLVEKLSDYLKLLGLTINAEGKPILIEMISSLVKETNFNGLKTIKNLAKDITFKKYSQLNGNINTVSIEDLEYFSIKGQWLKRFKSGFYKKKDYDGEE